jgi:hypothetical protein
MMKKPLSHPKGIYSSPVCCPPYANAGEEHALWMSVIEEIQ